MKIQGSKARALLGCLALAVPGLALAGAPNSTFLGEMSAIEMYCIHLEPGLEAEGHKFLQAVTQQFGAQVTDSTEYRSGYQLMTEALEQLDRNKGLALCGMTPGDRRHGIEDRDHEPRGDR